MENNKKLILSIFVITELVLVAIPYILNWVGSSPFLLASGEGAISMFLSVIMIFFIIPGFFIINSGCSFFYFIKRPAVLFKVIGIIIIIINLIYIAKVYMSL